MPGAVQIRSKHEETDVTEAEPAAVPMPTGDEVVELSRQAHQLALPMLSSFPADAGTAGVLEALQAHGEYWAKLEEEGVLFAGGPVLSELGSDPWSGRAMFIFRAQSLAAAQAIAEADPMHTSGARRHELRPWLLNHLVVPDEAKS